MKIMYLLFSFTVGGTEKLVSDICNEMICQGQKVYLYIVNDYYSEDMLANLSDKIHVTLQKRKIGNENIFKTMQKIARFVNKERIDVVHCNSFDSPELLLIAKALNPKLKVLYTVHDIGQYCTLNKMRVVYRNIICNNIIAISNSVEIDIISNGAKRTLVNRVYNAIDLSKYLPDFVNNRTATMNKKAFAMDNVVVGNVARIFPDKKGQDILIRAISKVAQKYPNIKCVFAGAADKEHEKNLVQLKGLVYDLGLNDNVEFLGNVTDIPEFLSTIEIFVLPSRFEGFGISLIEAMAMGVPCIASNIDGPAEIIGDNEHGYLFAGGNVDELAERLVYVIEHYSKEKSRAIQNIDYVTQRFDISIMCDKLLELYAS